MARSPESEEGPRFVRTNPRIPALLGTLNVIFGAMLLLYAIGWIAWTLAGPSVIKSLMSQEQIRRSEEKATKEARLAKLKDEERAESSAEKKDKLNQEIAALDKDLELNYEDLDRFFEEEDDLRVLIPDWIDRILCLVGGILMIVSGIGLLSLRQWGRTLALWVAGTQLVWAAFVFIYALTVTIPLAVDQVMADYRKQEAKTGPIPFPGSARALAQMTAGAAGAGAVANVLLSAIYPSITLWLLNKKTVRTAFLVVPRREKPQVSSLSDSEST